MSFSDTVRHLILIPACLIFLMTCAAPSKGQTQCLKKSSDIPAASELFGFHLGMLREDIKRLVPQTVFGKTDGFGVSKTTINPSFDPTINQKRFAAVRSISLDLLDDRLTSLWIGFDENFKVHTVEEFLPLIASALNLPNAWSSWKGRGQQMRCADFQVIVSRVAGGPSLRIQDTTAEDLIAERRQAKEDGDSAAPANETRRTEEILGDKETHTFYSSGCQPVQEVTAANRVVFRTVEEAEKAGFKLAKECH